MKTHIDKDYRITLQYPVHWKEREGYNSRYQGEDGFFQYSAIIGNNDIDEVANNEAFHKLLPYGSKPTIEITEVDGQPAMLIKPSEDQPEEMDNQGGLIVKYPNSVIISDQEYNYFVLWGDKEHIELIAKTIKFLSN